MANMRKYGMTRACVPNRDADKRRRFEAVEKRLSHLESKSVDPCQCNTCSGCSPLPY